MYETQYRNAATPVIPSGTPTFTESELVVYLLCLMVAVGLIVAVIRKLYEIIYKPLDK